MSWHRRGVLEKHHKVELLDESIEAAVKLSHRYIPSRQLPDKAISLLDTACARVAVSQHSTPAEVEDIERRLSALEIEQGIIEREEAIGIDVTERKSDVEASIQTAQIALEAANVRWEEEKELVGEILDLRAKLRGVGHAIDETTAVGDAPLETAEEEAAEDAASDDVADSGAEPEIEEEPFDRDAALGTLRERMAQLLEHQARRR